MAANTPQKRWIEYQCTYCVKSFELASVEAAVSGDYNKALLAMMINPLVGSQKLAITVLDELLMAHRKYLPQFADWYTKRDAEAQEHKDE